MNNYASGIKRSMDIMRNLRENAARVRVMENLTGQKFSPAPMSESVQRELSPEEVKEHIDNFVQHFKDKNIVVDHQFGAPQKLTVYEAGVLWSGTIDGIIHWQYNGYRDINNRTATVWIDQQSPMELSENTVAVMAELKSYFEIFVSSFMETDFTSSQEIG